MNFYEKMSPFNSFLDFTLDCHYSSLPNDWSIIITDIKGSTQAIAEGRYKEVNFIGAAAVVVARKALGGGDFPFVFGGDGTTIIIPTIHSKIVTEALCSLKSMALSRHNLDLRVGIVTMEELQQFSTPVEVAKFELTAGRSIALIRGAGISYAEKLIKGQPEKYTLPLSQDSTPDLEGLSCRWNPIPSRKGKILSLIVASRKGKTVYEAFMQNLQNVIPDGLEGSNPTNVDLAQYDSFIEILKRERKIFKSSLSPKFILKILEIVYCVLVFKYNMPAIFFKAKLYQDSMRTHSDFRKFDDVLKMVIDCGAGEVLKIQTYLDQEFQAGNLFYGTFETDHSLMTCYVDALGQGQHIHFIDADKGGYALAAVGLKKQIKEAQPG